MTERLRIALVFASYATYAPTRADQLLHTQQVINLLVGERGDGYDAGVSPGALFPSLAAVLWPDGVIPGLIPDARRLKHALALLDRLDPSRRDQAGRVVSTLTRYLDLALDAMHVAGRARRYDDAYEQILRGYAFLLAAYGPAAEPTPGGLGALRQLLGDALEASDRR
jgi:hypothetical protein